MSESVFRLFVSSPGDVAAERARLEAVVEKLNAEFKDRARFDAVRWETNFYSAHETFQKQIPEAADCDLVVAIFRARLGSPLPQGFRTSGRRGALSVRNSLRGPERDREAARRRAAARHLRVPLSARSAGLAQCGRSRRHREPVAGARGLLRTLVQDRRRPVRRRVPALREHGRFRRADRGMPAPVARQARDLRARDVGPHPFWLAFPRPRGVRRRPRARLLRPRSRDPSGDRALARGEDAVSAHPRRQRRRQVVAVARRADAEARAAGGDPRNRPLPPRADDARARSVRRARRARCSRRTLWDPSSPAAASPTRRR